MNFMKSHESKNLFDGTLIGGVFTDADWTISPIVSTTTFKSIKVYLSAGTYTFGFEIPVNIVRTVIDGQYAQAYDTNVTSYTITITANGYVGISFRATASSTEPWDNSNIMLNTGSTALPYEPYSSEVWHDIPHYIHNTSTDTITTPADIYANSTTATVGLKGNTVQSGTPTPDSPIMPQGTGERTGNLLLQKLTGVTIDSSGKIVSDANYDTYIAEVSDGETYTVSNVTDTQVFGFFTTKPTLGANTYNSSRTIFSTSSQTLTVPTGENIKYIGVRYNIGVSNAMLNTGSTALPYELYGIKIPISSANTTTPVYLGEVQTTRKIKKLVLDGTENWKYSTSSQVHWIENVPNDYDNTLFAQITTVCTHYKCIQNNTGFSGMVNGDLRLYAKATSPIAHELYIKDETYTSAADFKAYLAAQYAAGTPVTVWYVLSSATTGIVNEPIRKIGDYADTVSGITIPTITGKDTFDVQTTLKPSEVELTYTGWHDAQCKEWDGSEWQ